VKYEQPVGVVTATEPAPPLAGHEESVGTSETVQLAAFTIAVKVWPAMVEVCVCATFVELAGIVSDTAPFPVPELGEAPKPEAVHEQPEFEVVIVTLAIPPAAEIVMFDGLIP
jgi:hypothetical protein